VAANKLLTSKVLEVDVTWEIETKIGVLAARLYYYILLFINALGYSVKGT